MRTIKFRAYNKKLKKMEHDIDLPYLWQNGWDCAICQKFPKPSIDNKEKMPTWMENSIFMQFTGLLDSKGVEINEGDIVKYRHMNNVPFRKAQIRCIDSTITLVIDTIDGFIYHLTGNRNEFDLTKSEVIGNIYEHKHLLDGK